MLLHLRPVLATLPLVAVVVQIWHEGPECYEQTLRNLLSSMKGHRGGPVRCQWVAAACDCTSSMHVMLSRQVRTL